MGFELCRRVSDILSLKLAEGREQRTPSGATYLESDKANVLWDELQQWLLEANREELTFEVYTKDGKPSAVALGYMARDILKNGRYSETPERALLKANGFEKNPSEKK